MRHRRCESNTGANRGVEERGKTLPDSRELTRQNTYTRIHARLQHTNTNVHSLSVADAAAVVAAVFACRRQTPAPANIESVLPTAFIVDEAAVEKPSATLEFRGFASVFFFYRPHRIRAPILTGKKNLSGKLTDLLNVARHYTRYTPAIKGGGVGRKNTFWDESVARSRGFFSPVFLNPCDISLVDVSLQENDASAKR